MLPLLPDDGDRESAAFNRASITSRSVSSHHACVSSYNQAFELFFFDLKPPRRPKHPPTPETCVLVLRMVADISASRLSAVHSAVSNARALY